MGVRNPCPPVNPAPIWADLYAPASYSEASAAERLAVVNGCGSAGWKVDLVPDNLLGVGIREACNIHDWMYHKGTTRDDKDTADTVFLNNMVRLVDASTGWRWMRRTRKALAFGYYFVVSRCGGPAFWAKKNAPEETFPVQV